MKNRPKNLLPVLILVGLFFGLSITASATDSSKRGNWVNSPNGWWFECTDGTYPRNGLYEIDGIAYAFDSNGYMVTGWYYYYDNWYYFNSSGIMQKDWVYDTDSWYYLDPTYGYMYANSIFDIDGDYYGFSPSGRMITGWYKKTLYNSVTNNYQDLWYYFGSGGAAQNGWFWDNYFQNWFYFSNHQMLTGLYRIDNEIYYFDSSGQLTTGWQYILFSDTGSWYHFAPSGAADKGWFWDTNWYYLDPNYRYMYADGSYLIDGELHQFEEFGSWIPN